MRIAVLLALVACAPTTPLTTAQATGSAPRIQRPPPNAPPDPIGTTRPGDRSCTENRDCKVGELCFAPDFTPAPTAPQCQTDPQCPSGNVCSATACVPPCTASSCGPGQHCRDDGHCAPIPCTDPRSAICPQNFRCNSASSSCDRLSCTSRSQCDQGVCYRGQCFAHDAYCMPQTHRSAP
jgi:hypothetical protein